MITLIDDLLARNDHLITNILWLSFASLGTLMSWFKADLLFKLMN
jgi:hypothetical protein